MFRIVLALGLALLLTDISQAVAGGALAAGCGSSQAEVSCGGGRVRLFSRVRARRSARLSDRLARRSARRASCGSSQAVASCGGAAATISGATASGMPVSFQSWADREVSLMLATGTRGHVQAVPSGARFAGVGWASSGTPSTCVPASRLRLVADAVRCGPGGCVRARLWQ